MTTATPKKPDSMLVVSLKDVFNNAQCVDAMNRIKNMEGVRYAGFTPQGCFGLNFHEVLVGYDPDNAVIRETIEKMPEVSATETLPPPPRI